MCDILTSDYTWDHQRYAHMPTIDAQILFPAVGRYYPNCQTTYKTILDDIFKVIKEFFYVNTQLNLQVTIINVIQSVSRALEGEFKMYLSDVLTLLLGVFEDDKSAKKVSSLHVLKSFVIFGQNIEEFVDIIVPTVVKCLRLGHWNFAKPQ